MSAMGISSNEKSFDVNNSTERHTNSTEPSNEDLVCKKQPCSNAVVTYTDAGKLITKPADCNDKVTPDDILNQLGGCGTFQILLVFIVHMMKLVVCFSLISFIFFAYTPKWKCVEDSVGQNSPDISLLNNTETVTGLSNVSRSTGATTHDEWNQQCTTSSGKACTLFVFEAGTKTLTTQFDLVCGYAWVPATIMSIQMAGMCAGSLLSGQLSDMFGRRAPMFSSMVLLFIFHLVSYFATTWTVIAVSRFFIGIGCAFYLCICYTVLSEYTLSEWRSWITGVPTWNIFSGLLALFAWWLRDWKQLTLAMAILSLITMTAWFYVPESFRWFITQNKFDQAESLVKRISKWNKHPAPDFQRMYEMVSSEKTTKSAKKYSVFVLFRRLQLLKITVPLIIIWCTTGMIAYGINFAVQKLSGDIYLNIFLFSVASSPSKLISIFLQNQFGRKIAVNVAFSVCLLGGLTVAIIQYIDTPLQDSLTNYCALAASFGVNGVLGPLRTITLELYPTVVRNTGYGFVGIFARVGAIIAPQFVYFNDMVPGLLYFMVAVMSCLSILSTCLLPETMNTSLTDQLGETRKIIQENGDTSRK